MEDLMKEGMLPVLGFILLFGLGNYLYAQSVVSLDEAISNGAIEIADKLQSGTKVVVLNFQSPSQRLSDHVLDGMMIGLLKSGKVTVVDRANLELIRQEMKFQLSGEVSDESAQSIGRILGAQSIVSGRFEDMGNNYRVIFRTIAVETAELQALSSVNVRKDSQIAALMGEEVINPGVLWGYGALNIAFGLGSYLQGDIRSGLFVTGGYVLSLGLIIWEVAGMKYEDALAGFPGTLGLGLAGATLVFGFIRPFMYAKNSKVAFIMDGINIAWVLDARQESAVQLTYTYKF
jgi:TolB-like protein